MTTVRGKKYCSVFGCLSNDFQNSDMSFFSLPTHEDTRLRWLRLIDREDLANKQHPEVRICQIHFRPEDIAEHLQRRRLRKNCLPCFHLPETKQHKECQTDVTSSNTLTQIELPICSFSCETEAICTSGNVVEITASCESQRNMFFTLCDRFLPKNFAEKVKAQVFLPAEAESGDGFAESSQMQITSSRTIKRSLSSQSSHHSDHYSPPPEIPLNLEPPPQVDQYDEYDHFGLMIASKIRRITSFVEKETVMNEIHNLVFKSLVKTEKIDTSDPS